MRPDRPDVTTPVGSGAFLDIEPGVHASNNCNMPGWLDRLLPGIDCFMHRLAACILLIVFQELIGI